MRLNFSESQVEVFKQNLEDKYLEIICTVADVNGGSWYNGKVVYANQ